MSQNEPKNVLNIQIFPFIDYFRIDYFKIWERFIKLDGPKAPFGLSSYAVRHICRVKSFNSQLTENRVDF